MSELVGAGVIGTGFMALVHARAIRAACGSVVVVAGSSPASSRLGAERLGAEAWASSAEELIARDDLDVVHICTPNHLHGELALAAFRAGKHVVCEKPLATDLATARTMIEAAVGAGVVHTVPFVYRYYPTVRDARQRVVDGRAGRIHSVHGSYLQDWLSSAGDDNWRMDPKLGGPSGAFADIGVHWCDLAEFVTGQRIVRVSAQLSRVYDQRGESRVGAVNEDRAVVQFETDEHAIGSVVVSQASPGRKNRLWLSVDGTEQSVAFDQERPEHLVVGTREHTIVVPRGASAETAGAIYDRVPAGHPQGYQDCFNAFVDDTYRAIGGHTPAGLPTFADGLRAAILTEAVIASASRQAWVDVPTR